MNDDVTQLRCFFRRDLQWHEGRLKGQAFLYDMDGQMVPPEGCDEVEAILFSKYGLELIKAAQAKGYCVRERRSHFGSVMAMPKCALNEIPANPLNPTSDDRYFDGADGMVYIFSRGNWYRWMDEVRYLDERTGEISNEGGRTVPSQSYV